MRCLPYLLYWWRQASPAVSELGESLNGKMLSSVTKVTLLKTKNNNKILKGVQSHHGNVGKRCTSYLLAANHGLHDH